MLEEFLDLCDARGWLVKEAGYFGPRSVYLMFLFRDGKAESIKEQEKK